LPSISPGPTSPATIHVGDPFALRGSWAAQGSAWHGMATGSICWIGESPGMGMGSRSSRNSSLLILGGGWWISVVELLPFAPPSHAIANAN